MRLIKKFIDKFVRWLRVGWEDKSFSFGHLFLAIAVWDTLVAAFDVIVLPRVYSPDMLIYMTPVSQLLPIAICLTIAGFGRVGLKTMFKAYAAIGVIAFATFMLWGPQSEAWLNHWGFKLIS